jgi:hypothetical protein
VPKQTEDLQDQKERELRRIQAKINKDKKEIAEMKKGIDGNLGGNDLADMENQQRFLKRRVDELEEEHASLEKVSKA